MYCLLSTECGGDAASVDAPSDYDPSSANDAEFQKTLTQWQNETAVQDPEVDAIFSSGASKNPKSIAVS